MRSTVTGAGLMFMLFFFAARVAFANDSGGIDGVVRDEKGQPLPGVSLTLTGHRAPAAVYRAASGSGGTYQFSRLVPDEYSLKAELSGYSVAERVRIVVTPAEWPVTQDLTLTSTSQATSRPPLQLQASGLRGLIDPGGYSASAGADAASGILRGMADVKRNDNSFGVASNKRWPCDLEPKLLKALEENSNLESNRNLGEFYVAHGRHEKAIPYLDHALQFNANDYIALRDLGLARMQSGQYDEARTQLNAMLSTFDKPEVHQLLAKADEASGMFDTAADEYRKAQAEEPNSDNLFGVGYELILAGRLVDALTAFQDARFKHPHVIQLRVGEGTAQFLLGHAAQSVRDFLEAADLDPADPRPYSFLAAASGVSGQEKARVLDTFKRFLDRAPNNASANYLYAVVLLRDPANAQSSRIESLLKRAVELDPALAKAHMELANIYSARRDPANAEVEYRAAIHLAPDLSEPHYRLATMYRRMGREKDAARENQLFQQIKLSISSGSRNQEIDLSQFVSVMNPISGNGNAAPCPAPSE